MSLLFFICTRFFCCIFALGLIINISSSKAGKSEWVTDLPAPSFYGVVIFLIFSFSSRHNQVSMKKWMLLFCFQACLVQGQGLMAFNDYNRHFVVFNHGRFELVSGQPAQDFMVGGVSVLYRSYSGHLSEYRDGESREFDLHVRRYVATESISAYSIFDVLKIVKPAGLKILTRQAGEWKASDSLLFFYDALRYYVSVYYNDSVYHLEDAITRKGSIKHRLAPNLLAFISPTSNELKVFYRGKVHVLEPYMEQIDFQVGRDILAYQDHADQSFKIFYRGRTIILESLPVRTYQVADDRVAYVSYEGDFKVFDMGEIIDLLPYEPDFFDMQDQVLLFGNQNKFCVYKERTYDVMEHYIPEHYQMSRDKLLYVSANGEVVLYHHPDGKQIISTENFASVELLRNVVLVHMEHNRFRVWYQGATFNY